MNKFETFKSRIGWKLNVVDAKLSDIGEGLKEFHEALKEFRTEIDNGPQNNNMEQIKEEIKKSIEITLSQNENIPKDSSLSLEALASLTGKLKSTPEVFRMAVEEALELANEYLEDKDEKERLELLEFIQETANEEYKKWLKST